MTKLYTAIIFFSLFLVTQTSYSENLPTVEEVLGNKYYVYVTKKGDTLFGIARMFNWDDNELARINRGITSPIAKGTKIYYPCDDSVTVTDIPTGITNEISSSTNDDRTPLIHKIKRGETVYGISRLYNIPIEQIYSLNPGSNKGIKEGDVLKLRDSENNSNEENPDYYTIKKGDTLYKIAKKYGTSIASILELNPGISERNFRADAVIRLPKRGEGLKKEIVESENIVVESFDSYKVSKKDTWSTIAEQTGIDEETLRSANKNVDVLKNKEIISIPIISVDTVYKEQIYEDPRENSYAGITEIYEDVHGIFSDSIMPRIKILLLLSQPTSRKDMDFTRGFLTAVNNLNPTNYKLDIKVINGNVTPTEVLSNLKEYNPTILFTTSDRQTPEYIAEYALTNQIPVVNTFDLKDDSYSRNPYMIQLLTPSTYFNDEIAKYIDKRYSGYNLLIVGENDSSDLMGNTIRETWSSNHPVDINDIENLDNVDFSKDKYLIYGISSKKKDILDLLNKVKSIKENEPFSDIIFIGRPSWLAYDDTFSNEFQDVDIMIPSRFFYDNDSHNTKKFLLEYKALFNMTPTKSYPVYAAMGYDTASFFIPSIADSNGDLNKLGKSSKSIQNDFDLIRPTNWSGFINPIVYLVNFHKYGGIDKITVK